jgi:glycosyltransferase involved in cell wall biosynthesis
LRCSNIALQLARYYKTRLIILQSAESIAESGAEIPGSLAIDSSIDSPRAKDVFDFVPNGAGLRYRWLRRSMAGPANSIVGDTHHIFRRLLNTQRIEAVVLEHLEGMTLAPLVRRISPGTKIILDAHNVDHLLLQQQADLMESPGEASTGHANKRLQQIEKTEKNLGQHVDAFWACSDKDRKILQLLNPGLCGFTVPNGVDCHAMSFKGAKDVTKSASTILFCGSLGYEANRDGLIWFARECWPSIKAKLADVRLCIIGRGGRRDDYGLLAQDPSVDFTGEVDSIWPFYEKADISICPLRIGSGTRLKMLETLSIGTPSVSTPLGCEGLELKDGLHVLFANDANAFADQCIRLIKDKTLAETISRQGRILVEKKYDWKIIGGMMRESIEEICGRRSG